MDTYFHTNFNCVKCGRCVVVCQEKGKQFLYGLRDDCPYASSDYVPCHCCVGTPCRDVCFYDAIEISRW